MVANQRPVTNQDMADLTGAFGACDIDGNGVLDTEELHIVSGSTRSQCQCRAGTGVVHARCGALTAATVCVACATDTAAAGRLRAAATVHEDHRDHQ